MRGVLVFERAARTNNQAGRRRKKAIFGKNERHPHRPPLNEARVFGTNIKAVEANVCFAILNQQYSRITGKVVSKIYLTLLRAHDFWGKVG